MKYKKKTGYNKWNPATTTKNRGMKETRDPDEKIRPWSTQSCLVNKPKQKRKTIGKSLGSDVAAKVCMMGN
jgi:hypothetical protein